MESSQHIWEEGNDRLSFIGYSYDSFLLWEVSSSNIPFSKRKIPIRFWEEQEVYVRTIKRKDGKIYQIFLWFKLLYKNKGSFTMNYKIKEMPLKKYPSRLHS